MLHNSVSGTERGIGRSRSNDTDHGKQHVIFERDQAYPEFIVMLDASSYVLPGGGGGEGEV